MIVQISTKHDRNYTKNYVTANIQECVQFWNREGAQIIEGNKTGELGSNDTNEMARTMAPDDFLLDMLLGDCRTFCKSSTAAKLGKFEAGRTRSHVWVHFNNERIMMIHTQEQN
jgi:hypothetical protein